MPRPPRPAGRGPASPADWPPVASSGPGAAAAWWAWGPARIAPAQPEPTALATAAAPAAVVEPRPETGPAPQETAGAEAADRLAAALGQLALATEAAAAQARHQAAVGQDEQAARRARDQRADAERPLGEVNARLQTARTQAAALDRQLQDRTARLADGGRVLAVRQAELAGLDRSLNTRRSELAGLERSVAARRAELADLDAGRGRRPPPGRRPRPGGRGYVRDWLVVGPFPNSAGRGHDAYFPAQAGPVDPDREYKGTAGSVRWRGHASPADYVDLAEVLKTQDPSVGYAVCCAPGPGRPGSAPPGQQRRHHRLGQRQVGVRPEGVAGGRAGPGPGGLRPDGRVERGAGEGGQHRRPVGFLPRAAGRIAGQAARAPGVPKDAALPARPKSRPPGSVPVWAEGQLPRLSTVILWSGNQTKLDMRVVRQSARMATLVRQTPVPDRPSATH